MKTLSTNKLFANKVKMQLLRGIEMWYLLLIKLCELELTAQEIIREVGNRANTPVFDDYDLDCEDPEYRYSDPLCYEKLDVKSDVDIGSKIGEDLHHIYHPWTDWSKCSESCGRGTKTRSRLCNHPTLCDQGKEEGTNRTK